MPLDDAEFVPLDGTAGYEATVRRADLAVEVEFPLRFDFETQVTGFDWVEADLVESVSFGTIVFMISDRFPGFAVPVENAP